MSPSSLSSKKGTDAKQDGPKALSLKEKRLMARRTKTPVDLLRAISSDKLKATESPSEAPLSLKERLAAAKKEAATSKYKGEAPAEVRKGMTAVRAVSSEKEKVSGSSLRDKLKSHGRGEDAPIKNQESGLGSSQTLSLAPVASPEKGQDKRSSKGRRSPSPAPTSSTSPLQRSSSSSRATAVKATRASPQVTVHPMMSSSTRGQLGLTRSPSGKASPQKSGDGPQRSLGRQPSLRKQLEKIKVEHRKASALSGGRGVQDSDSDKRKSVVSSDKKRKSRLDDL